MEIAIDGTVVALYVISMVIEKAALQLEALGNSSRLKIYRTLVRAGQKGIAVGQLQERVGIPASTLSHHLKRLVDTGLASQERQATTLICRADYSSMQSLIGFLADECCADEGCAANPAEEAA